MRALFKEFLEVCLFAAAGITGGILMDPYWPKLDEAANEFLAWVNNVGPDDIGAPQFQSDGPDMDDDAFGQRVDCDDNDASRNPGADELCGDQVDNDCDGLVDGDDGDAVRAEYCYDGNGDGRCDMDADGNVSVTLRLCATGEASTTDGDPKPVVKYIRVPEVRDTGVFCFVDLDNDGYGDPADGVYGWSGVCDHDRVARDGDCDDTNASTNPARDEVFGDGVDSNCDGLAT